MSPSSQPERILHTRHFYDFYEIVVRGSTIVKITRTFGDSQIPKDVSFAYLPESLQDKIITLINGQDEN
jgi:hypothetical protein